MQSLLAGRAELIGVLHDSDLGQKDGNIAERQQKQARQQLRHVQLPQRAADRFDGRRRHEKKRRKQAQDALEHQRQHRHHAARHADAAHRKKDLPVKDRIEKPHRAHERQDDAQLVKARAHGDPRELIARDGEQCHPDERRQMVFGERDGHRDIKDRHEQLTQGTQPVQKRIARGQLIHRAQLQSGLFGLIHSDPPS